MDAWTLVQKIARDVEAIRRVLEDQGRIK